MSKIIECQVNDEYVLGSGVAIGAAGSYGDVILRLKFNEMWDGLAIMATFRDALRERSAVVSLLPSMRAVTEDGSLAYLVKIPAEAKRLPGKATLTLSGYINAVMQTNDAGEISYSVEEDGLTNTVTTYFRVSESDSAVDEDTSVTPNLAAQVVAELNLMGKFRDEIDEAETQREKNESDRAAAEEQRSTDEINRNTAEDMRISAEQTRVANEANRENNESRRESQEAARGVKEEERDARLTALEKRLNGIDAYLDAIIDLQKELIGGDA